ncbi:MAG TPA: glutamate--tRNA ligase family protein [Gemmatimonadales bacterium]|nr:glutamate--tRNA ligase family protein [Gemmatimonadales bacterium]
MAFLLPPGTPRAPLTRFAPAPTGYLHLGHAASAVWVWGVARALGGRVLLRIEDHDGRRCRPEYERALLDDLEWLGLEADLGTVAAYRSGGSDYRQSARGQVYERELLRLTSAGLAYACDCSRRRINEGMEDVPNVETRYDGRCRDRGLEHGAGRGVRARMEPGVERFVDLRLGAQAQDPSEQCGDLLVRDRLGQWTYQFAVTVDDWLEEVDLVVRGEDLLDSTGRQLRLARLLGRTAPIRYLHHPLIHGSTGAKLSKANRDTGIRELRAAGVPPEEVLGAAAHATGLLSAPRPLRASELSSLFVPG